MAASYEKDFVLTRFPTGRSVYFYGAATSFVRAYQRCGCLGYEVSVLGAEENWDDLQFCLDRVPANLLGARPGGPE